MTHVRDISAVADDERGSVSLYVVMMFLALMSAAGIVIDGGYAIAARQKAANIAEQAARAGANAMSKNSLRAGSAVVLNQAAAKAAVNAYVAAANAGSSPEIAANVVGDPAFDGGSVTVTVNIAQPTAILSAFGVDTISVTGSATATSVRGITEEEG